MMLIPLYQQENFNMNKLMVIIIFINFHMSDYKGYYQSNGSSGIMNSSDDSNHYESSSRKPTDRWDSQFFNSRANDRRNTYDLDPPQISKTNPGAKNYSLQDANDTFNKFFQENDFDDEEEKKFFEEHYSGQKKNYHKILEVPRNATQEQIKHAYRKLALQNHPKKMPGNQKKFIEINQAYNALINQQPSPQKEKQSYPQSTYNRSPNNDTRERLSDLRNQDAFFSRRSPRGDWKRFDQMGDPVNDWMGRSNGSNFRTNKVYEDDQTHTKKRVTTSKKVNNGVSETVTTQQYEFPNGNRQVRRIIEDSKGCTTTKVYHLKAGDPIPQD